MKSLAYKMDHRANPPSGISQRNRELVDKLHRGTSGPFTPARAAELLSLDLRKTRLLLAYLTARGWLTRIRRGLYTTVPLGATAPAQWREDPWVVATNTFAPCYIAGWSAAEHWGLTEQIFRDVAVATATPFRKRLTTIQDTRFHLKFVPVAKHFGTRPVWRGQTKVLVSDPARTVIDMLDTPIIGGGMRHIADMIRAYFASEYRDDQLLVQHAEKVRNRAVFKRLGYLLERLAINVPNLVEQCRAKQSRGLSSLDPFVHERGRIVKRWNLRVNVGELVSVPDFIEGTQGFST